MASGEDPVEAFVSSAEAAVAGAESTKNMQAQVIISPKLFFSLQIVTLVTFCKKFEIVSMFLIAIVFSQEDGTRINHMLRAVQ